MLKIIDLNKKIWQWLLLLFLSLIWGTSFILMKKGLQSYSNLQVAAFRLFFSFVFLLPIIIRKIKKYKRKYLISLLIVAFVGNAAPAFLYTTAQLHVNSAMAGMLNSLVPFFTLILGLLFYNSTAKWINALGVFVGLVGALGLILKDNVDLWSGSNWYGLLIVLATLFYGVSANQVKYKLKDLDGVAIASFVFLFIGPISGIYLLFSDFSYAVSTPNYLLNLGYIAMLALFSSAMAVTLFNVLIKYTTALFASSVTYIIPIFAIFWGILDGEKLQISEFTWMAVIMLGVYLVNKR